MTLKPAIMLAALSFMPYIATASDNNISNPISITSDSMEAQPATNKVTFKGNVVAKQKDMTISSHELTANYSDNGKELIEILATGNVRVTQQDRIAVADRALFLNTERKIVLTGKPKVWKGNDTISGNKIIYYLDENRTVVEGGQERVRATIHPRKEEPIANPAGKGID